MLANVTIHGVECKWRFPIKHKLTLADLRAALTANGFPAGLARQLPGRHAFVRSVREWLAEQTGGKVQHSISSINDNIANEDSKSCTFQMDNVSRCGGQVSYALNCRITFHKGTGRATATDATVEARINTLLPQHVNAKKRSDINRLLERVERHLIGRQVGLCRMGGNLFVPQPQHAFLIAFLKFVTDIGGVVELQQEVVGYTPATAGTPAPSGQPQTAPPVAPPPVAVSQAISDRLYDELNELEKELYRLNRGDWKGKDKAKERLEKVLWERYECIHSELAVYHNWLGTQRAIVEDRTAALRHSLENPYVHVETPKESVTYIPDPDDDMSMIEVVSTPLEAGGVPSATVVFGAISASAAVAAGFLF